MTLRDLVKTVWFSRWLVIFSIILPLAGASLYVARLQSVYAATAVVQLVPTPTLTATGVQLDTDPSLVTATGVATAAATALGDSGRSGEIAGRSTGAYDATDASRVIISVSGGDPIDAVSVANAVATAYVADLQSQYDRGVKALQSRLAALGASIEKNQAAVDADRAARGPNTTGGLLEAQYTASMDQYQTLLSQIAEAGVVASPASVRQVAASATRVSTPPIVALGIAGLGGLLIGIGLAMARRGLDSKVRTARGLTRVVGAPVLGRLLGTTAARRGYEQTGDLPVAIRTATAFTQSVRELRTALQAAFEGDTGSVIVVTAADLDAPRSFFAANLAASWALSGRSVIVLSGDLRQPRLNAMLPAMGTQPGAGPAPVGQGASAAGHEGVAAAHTAIRRLHVQPELKTELDPADFLAGDEVRLLVERLRENADVVIIDAPPVLVAADATILGGYADGVLLAATIGQTEMSALEESAERLRAGHARLLGIVLDGGATRERSTYAYSFIGNAPDDVVDDRPVVSSSVGEPQRSNALMDTA